MFGKCEHKYRRIDDSFCCTKCGHVTNDGSAPYGKPKQEKNYYAPHQPFEFKNERKIRYRVKLKGMCILGVIIIIIFGGGWAYHEFVSEDNDAIPPPVELERIQDDIWYKKYLPRSSI